MAFTPDSLSYPSLVKETNTRTYKYTTTDTIGTIVGSGYFAGIGIGGSNDRDAQVGDVISVDVIDSWSSPTTRDPYECRVKSIAANGDATVTAVGITVLGSAASGSGAALVAIEDASAYYSSGDVEAALQEIGADLASVTNAVVLKGTWDASSGSFPGGGSAAAGWSYIVSVGGTVDGVAFSATDRLLAITDDASTSTYSGNWHKLDYTDVVASVDGKTGAVDLTSDYHPLMSQESAIADPSGGSTVDAEARTAVASILSALRSLGIIAT